MSERPLGLGQSDSPGRQIPATNHTELERRRLAHRPADLGALAREARKLAAQGLTARDIDALLGLGRGVAAALLTDRYRDAYANR
jgi:hypothetical protein